MSDGPMPSPEPASRFVKRELPTAAKSPGAPPADLRGKDEEWDEENWDGSGYGDGDDSSWHEGEAWHGGSWRQAGGSWSSSWRRDGGSWWQDGEAWHGGSWRNGDWQERPSWCTWGNDRICRTPDMSNVLEDANQPVTPVDIASPAPTEVCAGFAGCGTIVREEETQTSLADSDTAVHQPPKFFLDMPEEQRDTLQRYVARNAHSFATGNHKDALDTIRAVWCLNDTQLDELTEYFSCSESVRVPTVAPDSLVRANALANAASNSSPQQQPDVQKSEVLPETPHKAFSATPSSTPEKSQTHGAKYMRFLRSGRNPVKSKLGVISQKAFGLAGVDRLELFSSWCSNSEDWAAVEACEERYKEKKSRVRDLYKWISKNELLTIHRGDSELVQKIVDACKKAKRNRSSPDFPAIPDPDEYYVRTESSQANDDTTGHKSGIICKGMLSKEQSKALTDDDKNGLFSLKSLQQDEFPSGGGKKDGKKDPKNTGP